MICFKVLIPFFAHGEEEDQEKRPDAGKEESNSEIRTQLDYRIGQKEEVKEMAELVYNDYRNEGEDIVFSISYYVFLVIDGSHLATQEDLARTCLDIIQEIFFDFDEELRRF